MNGSDADRVEAVARAALARAPEELAAFLDGACGDDWAFRAAVERRINELHRDAPTARLSDAPPPDRDEQETPTLHHDDGARVVNAATDADRNVLAGAIAVHLDFVSPTEFAEAIESWTKQRTLPLEFMLHAAGKLGEETTRLLGALVERHIEEHGGHPSQSLRSLSSVDSLAGLLADVKDSDVQRSVQHLRVQHVESATRKQPSARSQRSDASGRFRVLRPHRKGGLGAVHVALDQELQREVALKEVREKYANHPEARLRLRVEAEITGNLEHPGVVPVYGAGTYEDGRPFYCMRFVRGDSLKDAVRAFHCDASQLTRSERNLRLRSLLQRFIDVCDAIAYAHSRGVLHRDLKPGNIMLGRYGETLVVDWGVAKAMGRVEDEVEQSMGPVQPPSGDTPAPTRSGSTVGTPEYMSPEQAAGRVEELGPATDIFSLGATLYCLLTGQPPYVGESSATIMALARRCQYTRPREADPKIPKALEAICLMAMAPDPADRYPTALDLAQDVECWLADEPVSAYRESPPRRAARVLRKNRTAATTTAAVLISLIVGLVVLNAVTQQKNAIIARQNNELRESRARLDKNFRSFRQLTGRFMQRAENKFSQDPAMSAVRDWITQEVLKTFREFLAPGNQGGIVGPDVDSQLWLVQLYRYDAHLKRRQGDVDAALKQYRRALPVIEAAKKQRPPDPLIEERHAELLRDYATTLRQKGDLSEAAKAIKQSLRISNALRRQDPDEFRHVSTHGTNLLDAASIHYPLGNLELATKEAHEAATLLGRIVDAGESKGREEQLLILALMLHSKCLRSLGRAEEAEDVVQEALRRVEARGDPDIVGNRHTLATTYLEQARVRLAQSGAPAQAESDAVKATAIWKKLASDFPTVAMFRRYIAESRLVLGQAAAEKQTWKTAQDLLDTGQTIIDQVLAQDEDDVEAMRIRSEILLERARVAAAQQDLERARQLSIDAQRQLETLHQLSPENKLINQLLTKAKSTERNP